MEGGDDDWEGDPSDESSDENPVMAEHRRSLALKAAVASYGDDIGGVDTKSIIDVAKDFEAYLKGD